MAKRTQLKNNDLPAAIDRFGIHNLHEYFCETNPKQFWMDIGAAQAKTEAAASAAAIATAKTNLIADALNGFKVEAAQTYATAKALEATEASLARALEHSVQGIYSRLDNMTQRLDSLITIANRADHR